MSIVDAFANAARYKAEKENERPSWGAIIGSAAGKGLELAGKAKYENAVTEKKQEGDIYKDIVTNFFKDKEYFTPDGKPGNTVQTVKAISTISKPGTLISKPDEQGNVAAKDSEGNVIGFWRPKVDPEKAAQSGYYTAQTNKAKAETDYINNQKADIEREKIAARGKDDAAAEIMKANQIVDTYMKLSAAEQKAFAENPKGEAYLATQRERLKWQPAYEAARMRASGGNVPSQAAPSVPAPIIPQAAPQSAPAAQSLPQPTDDLVAVINPQGRPVRIRRNQLQQAINSGYKQ